MAQLAQNDTPYAQAGNTRKRLRSRGWFFTINNFTPDDEANIRNIGADRWIYQEEIGNSGTPHLQVFLYFKNPIEVTTIHRWFPKSHHAVAKSYKESINYCSKSETRVRGPFSYNIELPKKIKLITEFKPWQQEILELIKTEPDFRTIHWYYDPIGNTGKTSLCKYICATNPKAIYVSGSAKDIKYAIAKASITPTIVLLDFSRSQEGHISYQAIEEIKNGIFFTTKYESKMILIDNPHVICFSNFKPYLSSLSSDRWHITMISGVSGETPSSMDMPQPDVNNDN